MEIKKVDRIVYRVGQVAIIVAAGCFGWNSVFFKKNK